MGCLLHAEHAVLRSILPCFQGCETPSCRTSQSSCARFGEQHARVVQIRGFAPEATEAEEALFGRVRYCRADLNTTPTGDVTDAECASRHTVEAREQPVERHGTETGRYATTPRDKSRPPGSLQRWGACRDHHHHGARAPAPQWRRPPGAAGHDPGAADLCAQLHLYRQLL